MTAPRNWQVIREVWNLDGCLIDSTFQSSGITEQEAASLAKEMNELEEIAPTYDGEKRVLYIPELVTT